MGTGHVRLLLAASFTIILFDSTSAATTADSNSAKPIEIGILEEHYCGDDASITASHEKESEAHYRFVVRPVFEWNGNVWTSLQPPFASETAKNPFCLPLSKKRTWYVKNTDGSSLRLKSMGVSIPPSSMFECVQTITSKISDDKKARDMRFCGWNGHPVTPPRVLCTNANFADKDHWHVEQKPAVVPEGIVTTVTEYVNTVLLTEEARKSGVRFTADKIASIVTVDRLLANAANKQLCALILDFDVNDCERIERPEDTPIVVAFDQKTETYWILGAGLEFLSANDLNNDGHSEIIMWVDQYNKNGYFLFDSELRLRSTCTWTYH